MATPLSNTVRINGQYNDMVFNEQSANMTAQIVGMTVTKTASPMVWVGTGPLTYTIRIVNDDMFLPLTNVVMTDILDPALTTFVTDSLTSTGAAIVAADVIYDTTSGLLTVPVPDVLASSVTEITFRVTKKT